MKIFARLFLAVMLLALPAAVSAQKSQKEEKALPTWNIKTNLLYDATTTLNLGLEFRTGGHTSLEIPVSLNPWQFSNNRKWKHFLVQPEFRWWPKRTFDGHFFGLQGHYAMYNVGNLPHGPFSLNMKENRYEGWLAGAGISYGYRWNFSRHWGLEATLAVGYAYMDYEKFECAHCGEALEKKTKNYFGPTEVGVNLIFGMGGKPVPAMVYVQDIYDPKFVASFIVPQAEAVKARSESGRVSVEFATGRSKVVPEFRNNAAELQNVNTLLETVKKNPDATVTSVSITGHASPEGTFKGNLALTERRANALAEYLAETHGIKGESFAVKGEGEDWAGLEALVVNSNDLIEKDRVLEIIRSNDEADMRERRLRTLTAPYNELFTRYYPTLRRSDYTVYYTVIPFTVEKGKEVIKTRPSDLSLNEMFLIANTYEPGSRAFDEVFMTAARVFPNSDVANLNAAASVLECKKDAAAAAGYLAKVKEHNAAYWNNMGMLQWLQGDKAGAAESFAKAGKEGAANAAQLAKHMQSLE